MAKWSANIASWTPTAVGASAAFTTSGFIALQGAAATTLLYVSEIYFGGLASSTQSPMSMLVAIDASNGATAGSFTGMNNVLLDRGLSASVTAGAAPATAFNTCTGNQPQRSSTLTLLSLAYNGFGGLVRWTALEPVHRVSLFGNAANNGELSITCNTAGSTPSLMSTHIIYEPG